MNMIDKKGITAVLVTDEPKREEILNAIDNLLETLKGLKISSNEEIASYEDFRYGIAKLTFILHTQNACIKPLNNSLAQKSMDAFVKMRDTRITNGTVA